MEHTNYEQKNVQPSCNHRITQCCPGHPAAPRLRDGRVHERGHGEPDVLPRQPQRHPQEDDSPHPSDLPQVQQRRPGSHQVHFIR